jgi:hypothetical protein
MRRVTARKISRQISNKGFDSVFLRWAGSFKSSASTAVRLIEGRRRSSGHYRSGRAKKTLKHHGCIKKASLWAPSKKSEESPMTHKLNSPHERLLEKAQHWNTDTLYKALSGLAYRLDGQSIRDSTTT